MTEVSEQEKAKFDAAKKTIAEDAERVKESTEMNNKRMFNSRPTPTQEEANLSASGVAIRKHDDDGSGPEYRRETVVRQSEAGGGAAPYQTRQAAPAHAGGGQHRPSRSTE